MSGRRLAGGKALPGGFRTFRGTISDTRGAYLGPLGDIFLTPLHRVQVAVRQSYSTLLDNVSAIFVNYSGVFRRNT